MGDIQVLIDGLKNFNDDCFLFFFENMAEVDTVGEDRAMGLNRVFPWRRLQVLLR